MTENQDIKVSEVPSFRKELESYLNKNIRIVLVDGRVLIGIFLCTDRDRNVIMGSCVEYLNDIEEKKFTKPEDKKMLGLAMVAAKHMRSIQIDKSD